MTHRSIALLAIPALCLVLYGHAAAQVPFGGLPGQEAPQPKDSNALRPGGEDEDVEELASELRDEDPSRRLEAVKSLASSKEEEAVKLLIVAMADEDARVRLKAIDSLGEARASAATQVLIQKLYLRDSEPWLKQRVLVALGKIGDPRAAKPIADFLDQDTEVDLIGTAIFSLGEIGDESTIPELEQLGQGTTNDRLRLLANDAVAKIRERQVNPEVEVRALRPAPGEVQRPATAGIGPPLAY